MNQHPSNIRIKIRDVTTVRDLDDDETGEQIARGIVYLDEDDGTWLVDTFDEMVIEIETLRLDVQSERARADQAENAHRRLQEGIDEVNNRTAHPWGLPR